MKRSDFEADSTFSKKRLAAPVEGSLGGKA